MKKITALLLIICCVMCVACSSEKPRSEMDPDERLTASLDDIFNSGAYDINVEIKYDVIDGDRSTTLRSRIIKNTVDGVATVHLQRINDDATTDEYYIGNKFYKADGKLSHANYTFDLSKETLFHDLDKSFMGDYQYVDGAEYKTYEFDVPSKKLSDLMSDGSGMIPKKASGSVILSLDGYPKGYRINATTEYWMSENMFYEYDLTLTVTVNAVGSAVQKITVPFEV